MKNDNKEGALFNVDDVENLRHMLGAQSRYPKRDWGFRNHFAPGGDDIASMGRLEKAGLVMRGRPYEETNFFHATEEGCRLIGLNKAQIKKALEG